MFVFFKNKLITINLEERTINYCFKNLCKLQQNPMKPTTNNPEAYGVGPNVYPPLLLIASAVCMSSITYQLLAQYV